MFWPRELWDFCRAGDIVEGYVSPLRDEPLALKVEEVETDRESAAAPAAQAAQTPGHWLDEVEEIVDERAGSCHISGGSESERDITSDPRRANLPQVLLTCLHKLPRCTA